MARIPIAAIAIPTFVVDDGVVADCNPAARALFPELDVVGRRWPDCFAPTDDGYTRRCGDPDGRWYRLDEHRAEGTHTFLATDVTDEVHARAILEGLFADCFVLDHEARLGWKLTPRRRAASSWSVDSHPIDQLHPDDLTASLERFAAALVEPGRRESFGLRVKHPLHDGVWEHVTIDSVSGIADPWIDGVAICSRVNQAVETQLAHTDSPFYSLAEAAPTGLVVVDQRRRTTYVNGVARSLLGLTAAAAPDSWTVPFSAADAAGVAAVLDAAFAGEGRARHLARLTPDGSSTWVRVEAVPQRATSGAVGVIVTLVDVTDLVDARADIDRLVDALQDGSDLVLVVEPDLRVTHVKGAGHEHFAALERRVGRSLADFLVTDGDEDEQSRLVEAVDQVLGGQSWRGELAVAAGDVVVPVSVLCVPRQDADGIVDSFALVARDISDLKQTQQRLAHLAMHDPLTGLVNRLGLRDDLDRELARWRRGELHGLAIAFVDLDDFKEINDEFGHEAGDHVLREVAARMQHVLRAADVLARLGGDEFVAVLGLPSTAPVAVQQLAARFTLAFADPIVLGGRAVRLQASVGVVTAATPDEDAGALLARADAAMYSAKRAGKNQVRVA
ncbi:MAG: diguanylate cyclase [Acidimicrobiia bacterium]